VKARVWREFSGLGLHESVSCGRHELSVPSVGRVGLDVVWLRACARGLSMAERDPSLKEVFSEL